MPPPRAAQQPLFGGAAAKSDKVRAAALGTGDDGTVSLDIGRASGLGVGSEFTAMAPEQRRARRFSPAHHQSGRPGALLGSDCQPAQAQRLLPAMSFELSKVGSCR